MATKKAGGSSRNGRDSIGRRLGLKVAHGQVIKEGSIILRQRGTKYRLGKNVFIGKDHTIHAASCGVVSFYKSVSNRTFVSVIS